MMCSQYTVKVDTLPQVVSVMVFLVKPMKLPRETLIVFGYPYLGLRSVRHTYIAFMFSGCP